MAVLEETSFAAAGGEPVAVTKLDPPRQLRHGYPQFLPDGKHFLFYVDGTPDARGVYVGASRSTSAPWPLSR